jgi:hypothetical protein
MANIFVGDSIVRRRAAALDLAQIVQSALGESVSGFARKTRSILLNLKHDSTIRRFRLIASCFRAEPF